MPLRRIVLPVFWATAVLFLGSSHFGADQTRAIVRPLLHRLAPTATPAVVEAVHAVLRKLAHLSEYGILARLWFGSLLARVDRTPRRLARTRDLPRLCVRRRGPPVDAPDTRRERARCRRRCHRGPHRAHRVPDSSGSQ